MRPFSILVLLCTASLVGAEDMRTEQLSEAWEFASRNIYPKELSARFSEEAYAKLRAHLKQNVELTVADVLNPFLETLGVSHTHLYDEHQLGYYFLSSLFRTQNIDEPEVVHIGAQTAPHAQGLLIDAVLEGGPAHRAGLVRGDIVTEVAGLRPSKDSAFFPYANRPVEVGIVARTGETRRVVIEPVRGSIHAALADATQESVRIMEREGMRIGYIHLWAGTDERFLDALKTAVLDRFADVDAVILDLRDGYGGAWWAYLDPFFPDSKDYFVAEVIDRDGDSEELRPELETHSRYYSGPLVVLVNEGVRSGKEALAYQFKKSDRATLAGTTTSGAFVGGLGGFAEEDRGFIFYLSVFETYLDGRKIEGNGITPHVEVPFDHDHHGDNQLERGILEILRR